MAERQSYPVIVEYTSRHVVWVEADNQKKAAEYLQEVPYESTNDQTTLASSWWDVREPGRWDWDDIYGYPDGPYNPEADAHVQAHRAEMHRQKLAADRAACTTAGHPDTKEPIWDGRIWCNGCTTYLEPATTAAKAEATR